jgi:halimadienyl-diphosphate synthase
MFMLKRILNGSAGATCEGKSVKNASVFTSSSTVRPGDGRTSGVAYDTSWVARLTDSGGTPLFPECTQWLLTHQKPDGSWGSQTLQYHDRILSTLGAIIALKKVYGDRFAPSIEQGERYIWEHIGNLKIDSNRLIGSELLLPALMWQAESEGLNLPFHRVPYTHEYTQKLAKIDESLWYSPETTLSFSLEFCGEEVDLKRLPGAQLPNGSVANSPAATAFFLMHIHDSGALQYLIEILRLTQDGSIMTVYPVNTFEYGWVMYNLILAHVHADWYGPMCKFLVRHLNSTGIGCSTESPLSDADDTAVVYRVLSHMGYPVDFGVFENYKTETCFLTYFFEMNPSVSTNIHVLDLVNSCPNFPEREIILEKLLYFLKRCMEDGHWMDKWHISPYYPTCHAVFPLCHVDPSLADRIISWIIDSQNSDGTWGAEGGTHEETAYAMQALLYYTMFEQVDADCTLQALTHIDTAYPLDSPANLWIGKVLYCPTRVVQSSSLSAWLMHKMTCWDILSSHRQRGDHLDI